MSKTKQSKPARFAEEEEPAEETTPEVPPAPPTEAPSEPEKKPKGPKKPHRPINTLSPEEIDELAQLRKRMASDEVRLWELEHPIIEFPKMVNGRTFDSRREQDAAGPEFADKAVNWFFEVE